MQRGVWEGTDVSGYLEIRDVVAGYGQTPVLADVSLDVAKGEFVALLGASGCGKTTLLRTVSGFVPLRAGRIAIAGRDVGGLPPERRNAAMVFQSYALWPHMTVAQNIGYGLKLRRVPRADITRRVEAMLALLQLDGLIARNVTELSGGQRQRVALGRALVVEPAVLLLDEPLSNLDARIRLELRHEIRALQQSLGITAVHVTHDREEAMVMADRIVVMNAGAIAQAGRPEDLYHRPASPFVATFMGADNVVTLDAVVTATDVRVSATADLPAAVLPIGSGGVHVAASDGPGRLVAHFRGEAASLAAADSPVATGDLTLRGRVVQVSYPGGRWRHAVEVGRRRFLVDDDTRFAIGDAVAVRIPPAALHLYPATARGDTGGGE